MPVKTGTKCRHCTRLIRRELEGTWVRVNHSVSDPNRPDSVCVKSPDRKHRPASIQPTNVIQWPSVKSIQWPSVKSAGGAGWPTGLEGLLGGLEATVHGLQSSVATLKADLDGPAHPHDYAYAPVRGVCKFCKLKIYLPDPEIAGDDAKWTEVEKVDPSPAICGSPGMMNIWHEPEICPWEGCGNPASGNNCRHWLVTYGGTMASIQRSRNYPHSMWLTPDCCPSCWEADETNQDDLHCLDCVCCDCECSWEVPHSKDYWTDKLGLLTDSPLGGFS